MDKRRLESGRRKEEKGEKKGKERARLDVARTSDFSSLSLTHTHKHTYTHYSNRVYIHKLPPSMRLTVYTTYLGHVPVSCNYSLRKAT